MTVLELSSWVMVFLGGHSVHKTVVGTICLARQWFQRLGWPLQRLLWLMRPILERQDLPHVVHVYVTEGAGKAALCLHAFFFSFFFWTLESLAALMPALTLCLQLVRSAA